MSLFILIKICRSRSLSCCIRRLSFFVMVIIDFVFMLSVVSCHFLWSMMLVGFFNQFSSFSVFFFIILFIFVCVFVFASINQNFFIFYAFYSSNYHIFHFFILFIHSVIYIIVLMSIRFFIQFVLFHISFFGYCIFVSFISFFSKKPF